MVELKTILVDSYRDAENHLVLEKIDTMEVYVIIESNYDKEFSRYYSNKNDAVVVFNEIKQEMIDYYNSQWSRND